MSWSLPTGSSSRSGQSTGACSRRSSRFGHPPLAAAARAGPGRSTRSARRFVSASATETIRNSATAPNTSTPTSILSWPDAFSCARSGGPPGALLFGTSGRRPPTPACVEFAGEPFADQLGDSVATCGLAPWAVTSGRLDWSTRTPSRAPPYIGDPRPPSATHAAPTRWSCCSPAPRRRPTGR